MRNPDLGQHLWTNGFADKAVVLIGADLQTVAEAPGQTRDVSFHITYGDDGERYCGTLNTGQQIPTIARLVGSGQPLMVEGRFARTTVTGQGGERYRMIIGTL